MTRIAACIANALLPVTLLACEGSAGSGGSGAADSPTTGTGGAGGASSSGGGSPTTTTTWSSASTGGAAGTGGTGGDPYPLGEPDCHPHEGSSARGAYFRKVLGEPDPDAVAIHLVGRLPRVEIDRTRWFVQSDPDLAWQTGPLDRPSVYFGGSASGVELDAGLSWDRVYHTDGRPTFTDELVSGSDGGDPERRFVVAEGGSVSTVSGTPRPEGLDGLSENFAFRPFWRTEGGWHNPPVGSGDNVYFYPSESVRAQLKASAPGTVELTINEANDTKSFSVSFAASGWGGGASHELKRVNSIDQFTVIDGARVGLESAGLDVLPTETRVTHARWDEVRVLGAGSVLLFHLDCERHAVVGADALWQTAYDDVFRLFDQDELGAETIDIVPVDPYP